jgi:hypothetical protein
MQLYSRAWAGIAAMLALTVLMTRPAFAADPAEPAPPVVEPVPPPAEPVAPAVIDSNGWAFGFAAYGWASGIKGNLRTLPPLPIVHINFPFDKVLQNLQGAAMAAFEAHYGRLILFTDFIYAQIQPGKTFDIAGFPLGIKLTSTTTTGIAAGGYRFINETQFFADGFLGVRVFYSDNILKLQTGARSIDYGKADTWAMPVVGGRFRYNFTDHIYANIIGFAGGTSMSNNFSWDLFAGVGYQFNPNYQMFAGYRVLKVGYRRDNYVYNVTQSGPVVGLAVRF